MVKTTHIKNAPIPVPEALLRGWVRGIIVTIAGTAILSWMILNETIKESTIGYAAMGIILISVFLASGKAVKAAKRNGLIIAALSGLIYWLSLVSANLLMCKGEYHGLWVTLFLALGGGTAANFLNFAGKTKSHSSRRRM